MVRCDDKARNCKYLNPAKNVPNFGGVFWSPLLTLTAPRGEHGGKSEVCTIPVDRIGKGADCRAVERANGEGDVENGVEKVTTKDGTITSTVNLPCGCVALAIDCAETVGTVIPVAEAMEKATEFASLAAGDPLGAVFSMARGA